MKFRIGARNAALLSLAAATLMLPPQIRAQSMQSAATQNSSDMVVPASDKGAFRILLSGTEVGSEQFESENANGGRIVRSQSVYRLPGQPETHSAGELRLTADAAPLAYKWSAQADKKTSGSVDFTAGTAKTSIDLKDGKDPYEQDFVFPTPHVAILDNNLYYQYALIAQLYDWKAGGQQTFPVLIPQDITPGSIAVESMGSKTVEGASLDALRVNTADIEILTYFDAKRRLMRIEVPSANVVILRR